MRTLCQNGGNHKSDDIFTWGWNCYIIELYHEKLAATKYLLSQFNDASKTTDKTLKILNR